MLQDKQQEPVRRSGEDDLACGEPAMVDRPRPPLEKLVEPPRIEQCDLESGTDLRDLQKQVRRDQAGPASEEGAQRRHAGEKRKREAKAGSKNGAPPPFDLDSGIGEESFFSGVMNMSSRGVGVAVAALPERPATLLLLLRRMALVARLGDQAVLGGEEV